MGVNSDARLFRDALRRAVEVACREWRFPPVPDSYFVAFDARIPPELQARLGAGIRSGDIVIDGFYFRARGLPITKGPYKLVGRSETTGAPQPHWEYFVQLGEYVRLVRLFAGSLTIGLEDGLMDVTVRRAGELLWCVEVKERAGKLAELRAAFERYRRAVPLDAPDRGNDGLRKSKYLVRHRPPYLSLLALGARFDYAVAYPRDNAFDLTELPGSESIEVRVASGAASPGTSG